MIKRIFNRSIHLSCLQGAVAKETRGDELVLQRGDYTKLGVDQEEAAAA
jgi:hypothetical protein